MNHRSHFLAALAVAVAVLVGGCEDKGSATSSGSGDAAETPTPEIH